MRERARVLIALFGQADGQQDLIDARTLAGAQTREQSGQHTLIGFQRQFQIGKDRLGFKHGRLLKLAANAQMGDGGLVVFQQIMGLAKPDRTGVGLGLAGNDIHQRGFAGAIGTD